MDRMNRKFFFFKINFFLCSGDNDQLINIKSCREFVKTFRNSAPNSKLVSIELPVSKFICILLFLGQIIDCKVFYFRGYRLYLGSTSWISFCIITTYTLFYDCYVTFLKLGLSYFFKQ